MNKTLVLENAVEESALPLRGRKRKLTLADWLKYYCPERLRLPNGVMGGILADLPAAVPRWQLLLQRSFLSPPASERYAPILQERLQRLGIAA